MKLFLWVAGILLVATALPAVLFFVLHLSTGEAVPLARAKIFWRWAVVVVLGSFDIVIFTRVFEGLRAIW